MQYSTQIRKPVLYSTACVIRMLVMNPIVAADDNGDAAAAADYDDGGDW